MPSSSDTPDSVEKGVGCALLFGALNLDMIWTSVASQRERQRERGWSEGFECRSTESSVKTVGRGHNQTWKEWVNTVHTRER